MANQLLLIELKGKKYLYDIDGAAFIPWENFKDKILFSNLKRDEELLELLGYQDDVSGLKNKTGHLMIQSHALYGLAPSESEFEFLKSVFPCVPNRKL
jgi:hypothetical protein